MARHSPARARLRIDFSSGHSIGPGKVDLLEAIADGGSLSEAARKLKLSYRRAWLLLNDLNSTFREPVVTTAAGGAHGGGAQLTTFGRRLISGYRSLEERTNRAVSRLDAKLDPKSTERRPTPLPRQRLARRLKR